MLSNELHHLPLSPHSSRSLQACANSRQHLENGERGVVVVRNKKDIRAVVMAPASAPADGVVQEALCSYSCWAKVSPGATAGSSPWLVSASPGHVVITAEKSSVWSSGDVRVEKSHQINRLSAAVLKRLR